MVVLNLEDVLVLERVQTEQPLLEGMHPRLVRFLLAEQRLPGGVFHDADPRETRFLQTQNGGGGEHSNGDTF